MGLPARKWKWRMQTGAWVFAEEINRRAAAGEAMPEAVVATDMIDLAQLAGLTRGALTGVPLILYFHENQYSYPPQVEGKSDFAWGVINSASALAADRLVFNSEFHRRDFFAAWRKGNRRMPDGRLDEKRLDAMEAAAEVIPVGIDFAKFDALAVERSESKDAPLIVWNHRWEHDKNPEEFFEALRMIKARGLNFQLAVCGENFEQRPAVFDAAREEFADEIEVFDYLESFGDYARLLWQADVAVSTSIQEFLGLSVLEAMWCGCCPLLPCRLSYPELLPEELHGECLYDSTKELAERLAGWIKNGVPRFAARQDFLKRFDWACVAEQLDDTFAKCIDV